MSAKPEIQFFYETDFSISKEDVLRSWLVSTAEEEARKIGFLNYVFLDDDALLEMNKTHLNHDFYTDVITFEYNEKEVVSGEVFISIDRVKDNADQLNVEFEEELLRVIIHGLLHLLGYNDKQAEDKLVMSDKEDYYLTSRPF